MKWIFAGLMAIWASGLWAQDKRVEDVIGAQIHAFQRDDFSTAFSFASPNIQQLFGTAENFGLMVQNGYPMVWRSDEVRFLDQREIAGALWQRVLVRDTSGELHVLDYQMIVIEGSWRINAVQLLPSPDVGA